ncbi:hypothetical protein MYAM1_003370 [Malassezia yamatoensis]|uniref:Thioredoxin domain-containing protein n=1 Tax=Malassezia yamatoensis TaxID=253288 RepID=A0AAJ6CJC6_9BASI|nr:hypothetical protein MYAM1_003370 [Malassezia yamatoensis]
MIRPISRVATVPLRTARRFSTTLPKRFIEEDVSADRFAQLLLQNKESNKPLLVDFFAEWCQPCKMLSPILHGLVNDPKRVSGREVDLVTVDVDKNMDAAAQFQVRAMPTVLAFREGKLASSFVGLLPEPKLKEFIETL